MKTGLVFNPVSGIAAPQELYSCTTAVSSLTESQLRGRQVAHARRALIYRQAFAAGAAGKTMFLWDTKVVADDVSGHTGPVMRI